MRERERRIERGVERRLTGVHRGGGKAAALLGEKEERIKKFKGWWSF